MNEESQVRVAISYNIIFILHQPGNSVIQVGSMNEESQVRVAISYNIIFILHQPGNSVIQVGSMNEESQGVAISYNIIFILHQPGNSAGSPLLSQYQTHGCPGSSSQQPTSVGTLGERGHMQFSSIFVLFCFLTFFNATLLHTYIHGACSIGTVNISKVINMKGMKIQKKER